MAQRKRIFNKFWPRDTRKLVNLKYLPKILVLMANFSGTPHRGKSPTEIACKFLYSVRLNRDVSLVLACSVLSASCLTGLTFAMTSLQIYMDQHLRSSRGHSTVNKQAQSSRLSIVHLTTHQEESARRYVQQRLKNEVKKYLQKYLYTVCLLFSV